VAVGVGLLLFYVLPNLITRHPITARGDTAVYTWAARRAGALGLSGSNTWSRPGTIGLLAALAGLTRQPVAAVVAAMPAALAASLGLASGAFVNAAFEDRPARFVAVALLTGTYVSAMALGYLATLTFLTLLMAGLVLLVSGLDSTRPIGWLAAGIVLGVAGLAHPIFSLLAGALLAGALVSLVPQFRRDLRAGGRFGQTSFFGVLAASFVGVATLAVGLGLARAAPGRPLDHSRDAAVHRLGMNDLVTRSYRRTLFEYLVLLGTPLIAGIVAGIGLVQKRVPELRIALTDRSRLWWGVILAWTLVTIVGLIPLLGGIRVPGQRLLAICLPVPMLIGIGLIAFAADLAPPTRVVTVALALGVLVAFAALAPSASPSVPPAALAEARWAGLAYARTTPGTSLVVVMDDRTSAPGYMIVDIGNYVRAAVPPQRVEDVYVFVGTPAGLPYLRWRRDGVPEHDRIAADYARQLRSVQGRPMLAVELRAADPTGFRQGIKQPGHQVLGPGTVAVAESTVHLADPSARPLSAARAVDGGPGPVSPWPGAWLAFLIFALAWVIGLAWFAVGLPAASRSVRLAVSPALGMCAVALSAIVVDALGPRLSGVGGPTAVVVAIAPPILWTVRTKVKQALAGRSGSQIWNRGND